MMMYSQCPQCLTVFELDAATLAMAHGCVSCSECGAVFDTIATLTDELPETPFETLPINDPAPAPPLLLQRVAHAVPPQGSLFDDAPPDATAAVDAPAPDATADAAAALPARFQPKSRHATRHRGGLIAACALLAVTLGLQLAWAERGTPVLRGAATSLGLPVPQQRDPAQLELLSRDIRRHPSVADALLISATVRNAAHFTQPYPVVSITLSDLDGNRIAMRRFRPQEYLHNPAVVAAGLRPGATAALVFEVHDPGRDAVAFEFAFQ